jgi:hypothetical protein
MGNDTLKLLGIARCIRWYINLTFDSPLNYIIQPEEVAYAEELSKIPRILLQLLKRTGLQTRNVTDAKKNLENSQDFVCTYRK